MQARTKPETSGISQHKRVTLTVGITLAYVLAFVLLDPAMGNATGILAVVPVLAAACLFGWRGGLVSGVLAFPLNSLLVILAAEADWHLWVREGGGAGTGALVVVGVAVGQLRDLGDRLKREITERKNAEEGLKEYSGKLEQMVGERTRELRESQAMLIRVGKMEAIGQLAAGVAHELNNPLGAVVGYADMILERGNLDGQSKDYVIRILKRAEQAAKIVRQLKSFAQPSEMQKEKVDLNEVVGDTMELLAHQMSLQGISITTHPDSQIGSIWADASGLEQVFLNIALNAKDAMPQGGELAIRTELGTGGRSVEIVFTDTGFGIPKQNLKKIFQPFFTFGKNGFETDLDDATSQRIAQHKDGHVDHATVGSKKGTGLGLSVSQQIVQDHSGHIIAESEEGRGATFTVVLPRDA